MPPLYSKIPQLLITPTVVNQSEKQTFTLNDLIVASIKNKIHSTHLQIFLIKIITPVCSTFGNIFPCHNHMCIGNPSVTLLHSNNFVTWQGFCYVSAAGKNIHQKDYTPPPPIQTG